MSSWLADQLGRLESLDIWLINFIVCTMTAMVTEVVSNTATANILIPILKQLSSILCYNHVYLGKLLQTCTKNASKQINYA